jgi:glycine/D-amino acid oxidase-like deaminating enzyme
MSTHKFTRRSVLAGAAGLTASLVVRNSAAAFKRHRFAVVGRGPMGAAAARHLATASEDVVVVGPAEPEDWSQHEGAFASHYDEGRQFELASSEKVLVRLAKDSVRGFQEVEKATGISFFADIQIFASGRPVSATTTTTTGTGSTRSAESSEWRRSTWMIRVYPRSFPNFNSSRALVD